RAGGKDGTSARRRRNFRLHGNHGTTAKPGRKRFQALRSAQTRIEYVCSTAPVTCPLITMQDSRKQRKKKQLRHNPRRTREYKNNQPTSPGRGEYVEQQAQPAERGTGFGH